jgi:hypothetical protein
VKIVNGKRAWRCAALILNLVGAGFLFFAISVVPATDPNGERYVFWNGETAAMIGSQHPWCLYAGWTLLIVGFAIQLCIEVSVWLGEQRGGNQL